ncbi:hypothetical protein IEQ34_005767 [Dendrobium chrysotoxum]|uniref:Guanylate-binding protein/Atlastin C-terminal domain-containing protein n=1 Tax=Dendrobium chrysotoxum TaxID=161865 RepID=A0AAV7HD42_DENCH|nr:hypothetical protein IEQ34_005767 [Dendrobium chrysotoxum]
MAGSLAAPSTQQAIRKAVVAEPPLHQPVSRDCKRLSKKKKTFNGEEFTSFLEQILEALNKGEIPSASSLVEVFNKAILDRCLKLYNQQMDRFHLPLPEEKLQQANNDSKVEARKLFDEHHFGRLHADILPSSLKKKCRRFIKILFWTRNISPPNCEDHCIQNVKIKWTIFKH